MCGKIVSLLGRGILETKMEICLSIGICTYDMFLFGLPGSNNDLNVLDSSPLIHNMLTSEALGGMLDG